MFYQLSPLRARVCVCVCVCVYRRILTTKSLNKGFLLPSIVQTLAICQEGFNFLMCLFLTEGYLLYKGFRHTAAQISHRCTYVSSLLNLPPTSHPIRI